jgi:hypothetical protein
MENNNFENNNNNIDNDNINDDTNNDGINNDNINNDDTDFENYIEESDNLYLSFDMDYNFIGKMNFMGVWYQFVGILGFICLGLLGILLLFSIMLSNSYSYMNYSAGTLPFLFILIIFGIPIFLCSIKLFKGGSALKQAINLGDGKDLEVAITYIQSVAKIWFILFIISTILIFIGLLTSMSGIFDLLYYR